MRSKAKKRATYPCTWVLLGTFELLCTLLKQRNNHLLVVGGSARPRPTKSWPPAWFKCTHRGCVVNDKTYKPSRLVACALPRPTLGVSCVKMTTYLVLVCLSSHVHGSCVKKKANQYLPRAKVKRIEKAAC
jgi:hypothetical protein